MVVRVPIERVKVAYTNFWPTFNLNSGFVKHLLDLAFPCWEVCDSPAKADLVLTSVFPHAPAPFPRKTIAIIFENWRPDYRWYNFSISSDFDDYDGRNVRCPNWYAQIQWSPDIVASPSSSAGAHNNEPLVPLSLLMTPRTEPYVKRENFCAFVASNSERFRLLTVDALSKVEPVYCYGRVSGKEDERSKYDILKDYTFNVCFENSIFPGYYTEKPLQAWVAGTIPLYFSDGQVGYDFNQDAFLNRYYFHSTREFVAEVKAIYNNVADLEWIWRQPLLTKEPSLDPIVDFLKEIIQKV